MSEFINASNMMVGSSSLPLASMSGQALYWIVAAVTFLSVAVVLFFVSTNFRDFVVGSIVTGVLCAIGAFSNYVGASNIKGNDLPFIYTLEVAGFVFCALIIGKLITRTAKFKKWWWK